MFNAAVTQTASVIISTQPNETITDKLIDSYQSTVVSDMSSSILLGQPPTPMGLAAHLAGSALGTLVTAPREISYQRQKQQEAYQKTQQAAKGEGSVSEEHKSYGMKPQPKPKKPSFFGPGIPEHGIEDMDLGFHELTVDDAFNGYKLELRFSEPDTNKAQRWQQDAGRSKWKSVPTHTHTSTPWDARREGAVDAIIEIRQDFIETTLHPWDRFIEPALSLYHDASLITLATDSNARARMLARGEGLAEGVQTLMSDASSSDPYRQGKFWGTNVAMALSLFGGGALAEVKLARLGTELPTGVTFRSGADPFFETLGHARISHPEEYRAIMADLERYGVKIDINFDSQSMAFGPNPGGGPLGHQIKMPYDFSISALRHEYGHFLDHKALGYPTFGEYFAKPELWLASERRQYLAEIRFARELGDENARRILIQNYLDEKTYIINRYYQRPYGYQQNNNFNPIWSK